MDDTGLISKIATDDILSQYLLGDFDVQAHATTVIQNQQITEQLAKLTEGISLLNNEIHSQVVAHHDDLLSQATGIETLEGVLQMMQTRIQSLVLAVDRIQNKVAEPYRQISSRTKQLRRLQETCDLLRSIIRFMYLSKRLHGQLQGGAREITKAAQSLNELDYLSEGVDLSGIDVIESDRTFVKSARKDVESQAKTMLKQGMESQNQSLVSTSLQVFHNLHCLEITIDKVIEGVRDHLYESLIHLLDLQTLTQLKPGSKAVNPGKAAVPVNTAQFRASLWTNMEKLMDSIYSACAQVNHLQKVLIKKRDPVTHICFMEELSKGKDGEVNILKMFWSDVTNMLTLHFAETASSNTYLKQAFEGEYPKMLRLFNDLWRRLQPFKSNMALSRNDSQKVDIITFDDLVRPRTVSEGGEEGALIDAPNVQFNPEKALHSSLVPFENAYLSRSLSRLFDPVNLVFSTAGSMNPPSNEEILTITKTISSELNIAQVDADLTVTVAKNVAKTVQLFVVKSEELLCTDGDASQVIGPQSEGQQRNVSVVNSLYNMHIAVSKVISTLNNISAPAIQAITDTLQSIVSLMVTSIKPLLDSVNDALESIILTMHSEDFSSNIVESSESQCSLYMRELQQFALRVQSSYLAPFLCQDFIMDSIQPVACQCIELFLRHASLIRPLGEGGKMRLAADFAQMELAVAPLCNRVTDLGQTYRQLRAFRPLLFQTEDHIAQSPALGEVLPYSTVIHFMFSRAAVELKSPHQAVDWSITRYSQWLQDHPQEKDRLTFIKGTLESYVQGVKSRGEKTFVPIYPVMLDMLQKGLVHHT